MDPTQRSREGESKRGRSPALYAVGAVGLLVAALLAYSLISQPSASLQIGSPSPPIQLTTFGGQPMVVDGQSGQVTVVNFFASWCDPCREEAADVQEAWRQYEGRGVQFYGIAYKDADSKAEAFLREFGAAYPSGSDPGNRTARTYGVTGVPETFVIDSEGLLARHFLGPVTAAELAEVLEPLLGP